MQPASVSSLKLPQLCSCQECMCVCWYILCAAEELGASKEKKTNSAVGEFKLLWKG